MTLVVRDKGKYIFVYIVKLLLKSYQEFKF
jgi:hypothetical protein